MLAFSHSSVQAYSLHILEKFTSRNYVLVYVLISVGTFCVLDYVSCSHAWFWRMKHSFYFLIKYSGWWSASLIIAIVLNTLIYSFLYDNAAVWFRFCTCILGRATRHCRKDGTWYKHPDINVTGWTNFTGCLNRPKGNLLKVITINDFLSIQLL